MFRESVSVEKESVSTPGIGKGRFRFVDEEAVPVVVGDNASHIPQVIDSA
jgi:hypothetical protein